jgi:arylsulfatase
MRFKYSASLVALATSLNLIAPVMAATPETDIGGIPPVRVAARAGAPNVLVWMLDDVGFAQLGCFGGLVATPNIDRIAAMGLRYSNYHTTPICSASRAAFLTGRNSHTVHVGGHLLSPRGYPGYDGAIPAAAGTIAENLRQSGYTTYALGKWDHVIPADLTPAGPFTYWPTHQGFDRFHGFLSAETDNWNPMLWDGITPAAKPPGFYHLNQDLADQAIAMINARSPSGTIAPFFMYWATGTAHAPHHAPPDWIAKYKGKFDAGWDVLREQTLKREIAQGLVPAGTKLAPRPDWMKAWDSLTPDQRRLYARQMEVFAAALSYADYQFGRILETLQARGELDNTMIVILSDNGASAEGAPGGTFNETAFFSSVPPDDAENLRWYDKWGGPDTPAHYSAGWAVTGDTPYRYYKQTTYEGGIHVPLIISWPKGIAARGEWRSQFVHVSDLTPTILEAAQVPAAAVVNDVPQMPFDGNSIVSTFVKSKEPPPKRAQYFEMYGNKGLWADGWKIVTPHHLRAWDLFEINPTDIPWELYNLAKDPGETDNLAARDPAKVAELDLVFSEQAVRFNVNPVLGHEADRAYTARMIAEEFKARNGKWVYPAPVTRIGIGAAPPIVYRSYTMTVDVDLAAGNETGPVFALGGAHGGLALYLKDAKPTFLYRPFYGEKVSMTSPVPLPKGTSKLTFTFKRGPAAPRQPSDIEMSMAINDKPVASQTARFAVPALFSADDAFDLGQDDGTAVADDYQAATRFPGQLRNIVFDFNQAK